jgi:anti-sigma-K factor RskA
MITCEQCRDELAEYALGHSDESAAAAVVEHLSACVVCRRELAETESAWSALAFELQPEEPRPEVLQRVLDRLDQAVGPRPQVAPRPAPAAPLLTRRQQLLSYALAATVLAALVGGFLYLQRPDLIAGAGSPTVDEALRDLAARVGKLQELEQMLSAGNVRLASLYPPATTTAPGAYVVWDVPTRQWHFYALSLPAPPAGKEYQLWAVAEGKSPIAGPSFSVDAQGLGYKVTDFPMLQPGVAVKAVVTLEPAGGSLAPTGEAVMEASL